MRQLPWYSFLYRLFGAQGTFWLWLLAPLTLWWTFEPAMIRMANRKPRAIEVHEIKGDPIAKWVTLKGLKLSLDRRLLLRDQDPLLPPLLLLIDDSDPAAVWWSETHALTKVTAGLTPISAQGGLMGSFPLLARKKLIRRFARLRGDGALYLPSPEKSVLLLDQASPLSSAPDPAASSVEMALSFAAQTEAQIARVGARVVPSATVKGVLGGTPSVLARRFHSELDLPAPDYALEVGRRPRELESVVFAVALIVLLLLAAGLYGAKGVPTNDSESAT